MLRDPAGQQEGGRALMLRSKWDARRITSATPHLRQCQVMFSCKPHQTFLQIYVTSCIGRPDVCEGPMSILDLGDTLIQGR